MPKKGRLWDWPVVTMLRERIRAKTPGPLPPLREEHPVLGLVSDVRRLLRRNVRELRRRILKGEGASYP